MEQLQSCLRGWLQRRRYLRARRSVQTLQAWSRSCLQRKTGLHLQKRVRRSPWSRAALLGLVRKIAQQTKEQARKDAETFWSEVFAIDSIVFAVVAAAALTVYLE